MQSTGRAARDAEPGNEPDDNLHHRRKVSTPGPSAPACWKSVNRACAYCVTRRTSFAPAWSFIAMSRRPRVTRLSTTLVRMRGIRATISDVCCLRE